MQCTSLNAIRCHKLYVPGLMAIANGAYDYQLRVFANAAKADGRKIYVRYTHAHFTTASTV
eukprot:12763-Heterococcus_DN1.PRE.2